ncbi:MAG: SufD family Fe-S cluster assembly protein [Candidatus Ancillula sp.]|jgi:Fe-S cluster assembly scaffold protein SufB|nr:SufD family Fe-S cluster assembly protein [Candidatus Ancillula sp.]
MSDLETITELGNISTTINLDAGKHLALNLLQFDIKDFNTDITINLVGEDAEVNVRALSFVVENQKISNKIQVNHLAPNCTSNVLYKYALGAKNSRASWAGNVKIDQGSKGTVTYEENRNLLLAKGARAISEPNLEILEGDIISAGHASATGRFDDEQIFYMQSRGIDKATAKRLVVQGFFNSVLEEMDVDADTLKDIHDFIERKLSQNEAWEIGQETKTTDNFKEEDA